MGDTGKGLKYIGLAALFGGMMYGIGKLRSKGKLPLTALGLTCIVCAPKGFDLIRSCSRDHIELEKIRIYSNSHKDSLDAILRLKENEVRLKDTSTAYFHDALKTMVQANSKIESAYKQALDDAHKYNLQAEHRSQENYQKAIVALEKDHKNLEQKIARIENASVSYEGNPHKSSTKKKVKKYSSSSSDNSDVKKSHDSYNYTRTSDAVKTDLEYIPEDNGGRTIDAYLIDVDKSSSNIMVYALYDDGTKSPSGIESEVFLGRNGGPKNGTYDFDYSANFKVDKKFLAMIGPVTSNNMHSGGTPIGVPAGVYLELRGLINNKKTLMAVHD